jgi:hypothetical protein
VLPDSLNVLSKQDLIILVRRREVHMDEGDVGILLRSTVERLQLLRARVREGKCIDEASEFARWVVNSGLYKVFQGKDASELERLRQDVLQDCADAWNNRGQGPWVAKSELEAVNSKLDNLANLVSALVGREGQGKELRVI